MSQCNTSTFPHYQFTKKVMPNSLGKVTTSGFCSQPSGFCPSLDQWASEVSWENLWGNSNYWKTARHEILWRQWEWLSGCYIIATACLLGKLKIGSLCTLTYVSHSSTQSLQLGLTLCKNIDVRYYIILTWLNWKVNFKNASINSTTFRSLQTVITAKLFKSGSLWRFWTAGYTYWTRSISLCGTIGRLKIYYCTTIRIMLIIKTSRKDDLSAFWAVNS